MKVCVLTGKESWSGRTRYSTAGKGELQIKLKHVGVCGSDLHFYKEGRLANWELDGPLALGHEPGGIVSAIGEGVEGFEIGDKVALEPECRAVNVKTVEKDITICANISNLWPFLMKKTVCLPSTAFIVQACATNCLRMLTQWKVALWNRFLLRFMLLNCQTLNRRNSYCFRKWLHWFVHSYGS